MDDKIYKRVLEHKDYLLSLGYDVVCTCLQGSQNYGLDEYSEEYMSDVDTKSIILPSLDDFVQGTSPVSEVIVLPNNEHAEVKDIRIMFEMFKKMNISYIELLYSDYVWVNPQWEKYIAAVFAKRDTIASYNRNQFLRCIAGMAMEKRKALCHPYPNLLQKIEKYGYDGKQLHHCARLYEFIERFRIGIPLKDCYKSEQREFLMELKKQMRDGCLLAVEDAVKMCDSYVSAIDEVKKEMLSAEDVLNSEAKLILDKAAFYIIKEKLRRELNNEKN